MDMGFLIVCVVWPCKVVLISDPCSLSWQETASSSNQGSITCMYNDTKNINSNNNDSDKTSDHINNDNDIAKQKMCIYVICIYVYTTLRETGECALLDFSDLELWLVGPHGFQTGRYRAYKSR